MSQRVCQTVSLTITVSCPPQFWVTWNRMSASQSHHGDHGHHGQRSSFSNSGAGGSTSDSRVRSAPRVAGSIVPPEEAMAGPRDTARLLGRGCRRVLPWFSSLSNNARSGLGLGNGRRPNLGSSRNIAPMRSTRFGSSSHTRLAHHHHGHQPQQRLKSISNEPLTSVVAQPTKSFDHHHHQKSTS